MTTSKTKIPTITPVSSSNLAGYHYDPAKQVFTVKFSSGTHYAYSGVSAKTMKGFHEAESKGSFFAREIRSKHAHERLEEEA
ncbi:KTSC domain-containing protein [Cupriavidus sp. UYPR2.512]|uniref:KTSC domain-containing protein n=1 Tax=Cupriavidus sp. UYPR2.512 TaxID=1080187 RepID=UPI0003685E78|nr:KTSC domain-containing protein [Cupriavidus sp. UYPR2.512]UIF90901.1 KTSC domain-containing protein [Cupriavidus necator]